MSIAGYLFLTPWMLTGLLLIPVLWYFERKWNKRRPAVFVAGAADLPNWNNWRITLFRYSGWFKYLAAVCLIFALARPVKPLIEELVEAESIEIALLIDLSSSMLAMDFEPNRLEAAKTVAKSFVLDRPYDVFTLIAFAAESYTLAPLTADAVLITKMLGEMECGYLEDGTAIGMGLATAVNRLRGGKAKSRIIILLTDGVNNAGYVQPLTASGLAKELGFKIYSIGVGTMGEALSPVSRRADGQYVFGYTRVEIDEQLLTNISEQTGGKYFRATDNESLIRIYEEIDQLEKTKIEIQTFKVNKELFRYCLYLALFFMFLELIIRSLMIKSL
jgi:Ca-activated chloride channel homolog